MVYDVFISYRREGGYETAKHINDLLVRDGYSVSFDIDTLREGDFDKALLKRVEECVDFLLIVDRHCFDKTISGSCKPDQDWLRQEVVYALKLKKNIVTVLLAGASFPDNLPDDISEVTKKNGPFYSKYSKGYFDSFYERLKKDFLHSYPRNSEMKGLVAGDAHPVAFLKLKTDFECLFYLDGEERMHLNPDEIQKIPLAEGEYELKFVSVENGTVLFTKDFVMPAADKLYKLNWVDVVLLGLGELEGSMADMPMPQKPHSKKAEREAEEDVKAKAKCQEGVVGGLFSVGPSVRVRFSKGNLQYHPLENKWRFAEHQYDTIGNLNRRVAPNYNGWIDLFGWGTGEIPTRVLEEGSRYDVFEEWGLNSISNGGYARHPWRTLTNVEWGFVFGKRHPNSGIRYVKATVNGVKGVILFPDDWNAPTGDLIGLNNKRLGFDSNIISDVEWASRFESNNAVFLPVTGVRVGKRIYDLDVDDYGYYWSSVGCESNEVAYCMEFSGHTMNANFPQGRCNGLGVRLVCPE